MITENQKDAIDRGAKWLDEKYPKWEDRINEENIRMECCVSCILGQLFNDYWRGIEKAGFIGGTNEANKWSEMHGFNASFNWCVKAAWIEEINKRKAVKS